MIEATVEAPPDEQTEPTEDNIVDDEVETEEITSTGAVVEQPPETPVPNADEWADIKRAHHKLLDCKMEEAEAAEVHKAKKKATEAAQEYLNGLIADVAAGQGNLFKQSEATVGDDGGASGDDDAWRLEPVASLMMHGVSETQVDKLAEAEITTLGALSDHQANSNGQWCRGIKGIGDKAAETIEAAQSAWFAANPNKCPRVKDDQPEVNDATLGGVLPEIEKLDSIHLVETGVADDMATARQLIESAYWSGGPKALPVPVKIRNQFCVCYALGDDAMTMAVLQRAKKSDADAMIDTEFDHWLDTGKRFDVRLDWQSTPTAHFPNQAIAEALDTNGMETYGEAYDWCIVNENEPQGIGLTDDEATVLVDTLVQASNE